MESRVTIHDLLTSGAITAPLSIQADLGKHCVQATIQGNGYINITGSNYANLTEAMNTIPHDSESTSDAWQFWAWYSEERQAWTPLEHLRAKFEAKEIQAELRTSDTHPLRIDYVTYPNSTGRIGLTFCPGKKCEGLYGGTWARDLEKDLVTIQTWGTSSLLSLMETHEFEILGVSKFIPRLSKSELNWLHLPIQDMQPPSETFETQWEQHGQNIHQRLQNGESIVIHCRGGLGRTGLLAARILVEAGIAPAKAVADVRKARKHSIETYAQEHYVLKQLWQK